jgi:O-antigen/teichoic acid export membrane protein
MRLSTTILFIVLSRREGATESGTFALALTFVPLFSQIAYWGMDQILTREVARNHALASQYLGNFILIRLSLSVVLFGGMVILVLSVLQYPPYQAAVVLVAGITIIFDSVNNLCQALYAAFEVIQYQALTKFLVGGLQIAVGALVLFKGGGALALAIVVTSANFIALLVNLLIVYARFPHPMWRIQWRAWIPQLSGMFPFVLIGVFYTIEYQMDTLILNQLQGPSAVGIYNAATTILYGLLLLPQAYRTAVFPVLSRLYLAHHERFVWVYQKSFKYLLLISLPIALAIGLAAYPIIQLLYTSDFSAAAPVLQVLLIVFVVNMINVPSARALIVANLQRWVAPLQGVSMALNIGLNLLLIPQLGVMGSAWARVGSSVVYFVVTLILTHARVVSCRLTSGFWQIGLASLGLIIVTAGMTALGWWWGLAAVIGLAAYGLILILMRGVTSDESVILREVWTHQRRRIAFLR